MYKLIKYKNQYSILKLSENLSFVRETNGPHYCQLLDNIIENDISIVEGADIKSPGYTELRKVEYPSIEDQLDTIYHSGVNAWKSKIKTIKDNNPKTIEETVTIENLPEWIQEDVDERQLKLNKDKYQIAVMLVRARRNPTEVAEQQAIIDATSQSIKDEFNVTEVDPSENAPL